jgi:hypothetical protein
MGENSNKDFDFMFIASITVIFLFLTVLISFDIMNMRPMNIFEPIKNMLERRGLYGKQKQRDALNKQINSLIRKVNNET